MNVELVSIADSDVESLAQFYSSEIWPYHSGPPLTQQVVRDRFADGHYSRRGVRTFWIVADGIRQGVLRVWDLGNENDSETPLFDIRIRSEARGKGIGTAAVRRLIEWVFRAFPGKRRIEATTRADNQTMQRVLLRCGFAKEAQYRQCWAGEGGVMHDCFGYGVLRGDWESGSVTPVTWIDDRVQSPD